MGQAQDAAAGRDGQAVVAVVAAAVAVTDLAQLGDAQPGIVQHGRVVQEEDDAVVVGHPAVGEGGVGGQEGGVRDGGGGQQAVAGVEVRGIGDLVGKGAAGMAHELVGDGHEATGAALVAQLGGAKVELPEADTRLGDRVHA